MNKTPPNEISFTESQQIKDLNDQLRKAETALLDTKTQLSTLQAHYSELQFEYQKSQKERNNFENQLETRQPNDSPSSLSSLTEAVSLVDDLLDDQSKEIDEIKHQRDSLLELLQKTDKILLFNDNLLQQYAQENLELKQELKIVKEENDEKDEKFNNLLKQFIKNSPDSVDFPLETLASLPIEGQISKIFQIVIDHYESQRSNISELSESGMNPDQNQESSESIKQNKSTKNLTSLNSNLTTNDDTFPENQISQNTQSNTNNDRLTERENLLLGHLENSVRCLRQILTGQEEYSNIIFNSEARDALVAQCARISQFVGEHHFSDSNYLIPNIFAKGSVDEQLKSVYNFIDSKMRKKDPYQILFVLFAAVLQVNEFLFNYFENSQNQNIQDESTDSTILQMKLKEDELNSYLVEKLSPITTNKLDLVQNIDKILNYIDDLKSKADNNFPESAPIKNNSSNDEQLIKQKNKQITSLKNTVTYLKNRLAQEDQNQEKLLEKVKLKLQEARECIQKANENRQLLIQCQKKIMKIPILKENIKLLTEGYNNLVETNKQLQNEKISLQGDLNAQEIKIQSLEESLKFSKDHEKILLAKQKKHKDRIQDLESINTQTISKIQKRSDDLDDLYQSQLQKRENEINDLQNQVAILNNQNLTYSKNKKDQLLLIAQLKASEKTLKMKVDSLEKALKSNELLIEKRLESQKVFYQAMSDQATQPLIEIISNATAKLRIITQQIGIKSNEDSLLDMINDISEIPYILADSDNKITQLQKSQNEGANVIEAQDNLISELKEELDEMKDIKEKALDSDQWVKWGLSLYREVTGAGMTIHNNLPESIDVPNSMSINELRFALQEVIISSLNYRTLLHHLNLLREEKKALLCAKSGKMNIPSKNSLQTTPLISIRPFILIYLFTKKLKNYKENVNQENETD